MFSSIRWYLFLSERFVIRTKGGYTQRVLRSGLAHNDQSIVLGMGIYAKLRSLVSDVVMVSLKEVEKINFRQAEG